jgi:hypothetical protein
MFIDGVKNRINTLVNQFNLVRESIGTLTRKADKKVYENNGGMIVSAIVLAAVTSYDDTVAQGFSDAADLQIDDTELEDETPRVDYANRNDVISTIETILEVYDSYLTDLDTLQTDNGGELESFIPNADCIIALNDLVNYAVSKLYDVALNARQERSIILEEDSNVILLAHRFYGLTPDDSTIDEIIRTNNIGLNELLHLRKGRKIVYYV